MDYTASTIKLSGKEIDVALSTNNSGGELEILNNSLKAVAESELSLIVLASLNSQEPDPAVRMVKAMAIGIVLGQWVEQGRKREAVQ